MKNPLISVIMPAYNAAKFIDEAIQSVLQQTYKNWELLILDDGSIDATALHIKKYDSDLRIKYQKQENQGLASARNRGLEISSGEYIAFLDADDLFFSTKLETCLNAFSSGIDIVYSAMELIDEEGKLIKIFESGKELSKENFLAEMFFRNLVIPSTVMAKRDCFEKERFVEGMRISEEYDLFLRWAHQFTFKYIPIPLIKYRRHMQAISSTMDATLKAEKKVLLSYDIDHIQKMINLSDYTFEDKRLLFAKILGKIGAHKKVIQSLEDLNHFLAFFYIGNAWLALGGQDEAISAFFQSIQLNENNPASFNNLGVAYAREGNNETAKICFKKALFLLKDYMDPQHNLALLDKSDKSQFFGQLRVTASELRKTLMPYS
jgi:glycosyltransferase involved in cell wall biosynthesis